MGSLPTTDLETSMSLNQPMKADAHYFVKQISGEGPRGDEHSSSHGATGARALAPGLLSGEVADDWDFEALPIQCLQNTNQPKHEPQKPDESADGQKDESAEEHEEYHQKAQSDADDNRCDVQED
jgi:hypothetical protein